MLPLRAFLARLPSSQILCAQPLVKELYRRLKLYDREHVEAILATRFLLATQGREVFAAATLILSLAHLSLLRLNGRCFL